MRYGEALPVGFNLPKSTAFWLQKDLTVKNPFDLVEVRRGDRVMDCGSCVGTFAAAALEAGGQIAHCYEPMPKNLEVLRENMARYGRQAVIISAALVPDGRSTVRMAVSGFSGAHSVEIKSTTKKTLVVPAVCFRTELLRIEPDVLKLDVEGAEYDLLDSLRPGDLAKVRCAFVEFHPNAQRELRVARIRSCLESEGLTVVKDRLRAFTAVRGR